MNSSNATSFSWATIRATPYNTTANFPSASEIKPLEEIITNIKKKKSDDYFEKQFSQNLILKLKRGLKSEKTEEVEYIKDCFGEMLDNMDFVSWISNKLGYKPNRMKKLLEEKAYNKQRSFHPTTYQDIYKFWLSNSINSSDIRYNVVNISKPTFLQQYRFITDENFMEKEVHLKSGTNKVLYRNIFTNSSRALHGKFNATEAENVSFRAFYTYKPYYVSKPTEKEKESCMRIDCLNPYLLLNSINANWKSTIYINTSP